MFEEATIVGGGWDDDCDVLCVLTMQVCAIDWVFEYDREKDAVDTKNIRKFQHYNPILRKGVQNESTVFEGEREIE